MRSDCAQDGIPVTGSSFDFSCDRVHVGVILLSERTRGLATPAGVGSDGTRIWTGMSVGVIVTIS